MRPPYGNYNQMVLDASGIRGQGVVIWDFELVSLNSFFSPMRNFFFANGKGALFLNLARKTL